MAYNISITMTNPALVSRCEELRAQRKLSALITSLLSNYFYELDKHTMVEKAATIVVIRTEKDIAAYLDLLKIQAPNANPEALDRLRDKLIQDLKGGEYIIDTITGTRSKLIRND